MSSPSLIAFNNSFVGLGFTTSNGTPSLLINYLIAIFTYVLIFNPNRFNTLLAISKSPLITWTVITLVKMSI